MRFHPFHQLYHTGASGKEGEEKDVKEQNKLIFNLDGGESAPLQERGSLVGE